MEIKKNTISNLDTLLPVFNIENFENYNSCSALENSFYIRRFNDHVKTNKFINTPHGHDFYLVLLVTQGYGDHVIDFNDYKVEPGSVFVLSPGQVHLWSLSDDIDGYVLFFEREYFLLDFASDRLMSMPFFRTSFNSPHILLKDRNLELFSEIFEKILEEYENKEYYHNETIRMYLSIFFIKLARLYLEDQQEHLHHKHDLIQLNKFHQTIDVHFREHLPVSEYSELMKLTQKQLSRICKSTVGKSPSELIQQRLILESKRLLVHTDLTISSIANELNFSDTSYFIRLFKKLCGTTPEKFRQAL